MVVYRHKEKYSISETCRFFEVSRGGYYAMSREWIFPHGICRLPRRFKNVRGTAKALMAIVEHIYGWKAQLSNSRTIIEMFKIRQKEMKIDICYMELSTRHRCKPSLSECIAFLMPPTSDLPSTHYQHLYPLHHLTPQTT